MMPQTLNFENRRKEQQHAQCNAKSWNNVSNNSCFESEIFHMNGVRIKCDGTRRARDASQKGTEANRAVNGYVNHGYRRTRDKVVHRRDQEQQEAECAAETECTDKVKVLENKLQSPQNTARLLVGDKKPRRRRKPGNKNKNLCVKLSPPQEEEDWEKEVGDVPNGTEYFGVLPYGPEEVVQIFRGFAINQREGVDPPISTSNYIPSLSHPGPVHVPWSHYMSPTEPDQFADAD